MPELIRTEESQRFVQASQLVSIAAQLVQPLNNFAGTSLLRQAQALLEEADLVESFFSQNPDQQGSLKAAPPIPQFQKADGCKDGNCSGCGDSGQISAETNAEVETLVAEIEALIAEESKGN